MYYCHSLHKILAVLISSFILSVLSSALPLLPMAAWRLEVSWIVSAEILWYFERNARKEGGKYFTWRITKQPPYYYCYSYCYYYYYHVGNAQRTTKKPCAWHYLYADLYIRHSKWNQSHQPLHRVVTDI